MENMAPRIETAEDLERIVAEQTAAIKAMGELVKAMDLRIRTLTSLVNRLVSYRFHNDIFTGTGVTLHDRGFTGNRARYDVGHFSRTRSRRDVTASGIRFTPLAGRSIP